jgi:hypothetical protein
LVEDLAVLEAEFQSHDLVVRREPEVVLEEARRAASALKSVLDQKPNKVLMNNQQYLEFEDWQTCARFYGITCGSESDPEYVEFGKVHGFKSTSIAMRDGQVISRATAYCLSDEDKWGSRPKYGYAYVLKDGSTSMEDPGPDMIQWIPNPNKPGKQMPKKEKVSLGEESVPLFQLASMSQTRANAKVLRNVLAFVPVLAGYRPTPAEELDIEPTQERHEPATRQPGNPPTVSNEERVATDAAAKAFRDEAKQAGYTDKFTSTDTLKVWISEIAPWLEGRSISSLTVSEWKALSSCIPAAVATETPETASDKPVASSGSGKGKGAATRGNTPDIETPQTVADPDSAVKVSARDRFLNELDPFGAHEDMSVMQCLHEVGVALDVEAEADVSDYQWDSGTREMEKRNAVPAGQESLL